MEASLLWKMRLSFEALIQEQGSLRLPTGFFSSSGSYRGQAQQYPGTSEGSAFRRNGKGPGCTLEELERTRNADEMAGLRKLAETRGGRLEEMGVALERALLEDKTSKAQLEDSQTRLKSLEAQAQAHEAENRAKKMENTQHNYEE